MQLKKTLLAAPLAEETRLQCGSRDLSMSVGKGGKVKDKGYAMPLVGIPVVMTPQGRCGAHVLEMEYDGLLHWRRVSESDTA